MNLGKYSHIYRLKSGISCWAKRANFITDKIGSILNFFFFNYAVIMCHSSVCKQHSLQRCSWSKQCLGPGDSAGTASGAAGEVGQSSGTLSGLS